MTGYELSVGQSSGVYDNVVDIPLSSANSSVPGELSYAVQLPSDADSFLVLRAYDGTMMMSAFSNEIMIPALTGGAASPNGLVALGSSIVARTPFDSTQQIANSDATDSASTQNATEAAKTDSEKQERISDSMASIDFDGSGEHLSSNTGTALGTAYLFSVSMWAKPLLDQSPRRVLLDVRDAAGTDANRMTLSVIDGTDLELMLSGETGATLHRARFEQALLDREWQHLAIVFDAETDLEPRFFIDAELQTAVESSSAGGTWAMVDALRQVFVGADAESGSDSWRGQLGHVGIWAEALGDAAIQEISRLGHALDLRNATMDYGQAGSLLHYWRLGDDSNPVGFDYGVLGEALDLDDPAGNIDATDIVADGPEQVQP